MFLSFLLDIEVFVLYFIDLPKPAKLFVHMSEISWVQGCAEALYHLDELLIFLSGDSVQENDFLLLSDSRLLS